MQAMRDAMILAALGLALVTVRVDRVPAPTWNGEFSRAGVAPITDLDSDAAVGRPTRFAHSFEALPTPRTMPVRVAAAPEIDVDVDHDDCTCLADQVDLVTVFDRVELNGDGREWVVIIRDAASARPTPPATPGPAAIEPDCT